MKLNIQKHRRVNMGHEVPPDLFLEELKAAGINTKTLSVEEDKLTKEVEQYSPDDLSVERRIVKEFEETYGMAPEDLTFMKETLDKHGEIFKRLAKK